MRQSIGREKAIALYESKWWEGLSAKAIAKYQLFTDELCMPFEIFHEKLEEALGHPVFTHELALNYDHLCQELLGEADPLTPEEVMNLIPENKRIIVNL